MRNHVLNFNLDHKFEYYIGNSNLKYNPILNPINNTDYNKYIKIQEFVTKPTSSYNNNQEYYRHISGPNLYYNSNNSSRINSPNYYQNHDLKKSLNDQYLNNRYYPDNFYQDQYRYNNINKARNIIDSRRLINYGRAILK
jgi:hypothetical protein